MTSSRLRRGDASPTAFPVVAFLTACPARNARNARNARGARGARGALCARRSNTPTMVRREADPVSQSPLGAPQVLCAGEILYDLYAAPDTPTDNVELWSRVPGGGPANVAAALAQLGTPSAFIGMVGDDAAGEALRRALVDKSVNVDGVQTAPGLPTRTVFVRVSADGERDFVAFGGRNSSFADTRAVDADRLPAVLFYAAKLLMLPTLPLAFDACAAAFDRLLESAAACMLHTVVDVNWRPVFWSAHSHEEARRRILRLVGRADVVKLSRDEVRFLYGDALASDALRHPHAVRRAVGSKAVLITDGSNGCAYALHYGQQLAGRAPALVPPGGVVDTTGAGDAFLAGFLSHMLRKGGTAALRDAASVRDMVEFATATASFVIARKGVFPSLPSLQDVERLLVTLRR